MSTWNTTDGIGSIEVLDVFGNDLTVVNAARVSFHKESAEFSENDAKLVRFLAKHNHISPFFHPQIRLRIKMPIFVAREWYRHTIGLARNEVSRRYVDEAPQLWWPSADSLRERDPKLKQGSKSTPVADSDAIVHEMRTFGDQCQTMYNSLLERGVAPEIARAVLPQGMYTEFIETGSLAAYARIWALRTDPGAQVEIRNYAEALGNLLQPFFPVCWSALTRHE